MPFEKPAVVIDNGSYNIKAGFACDNHPVSIFRTVVGRPSYLQGSYGRQYYDVHIGDDAVAHIHDLELNAPVVNGRIVHWDNMERVWHHVYYRELKVAPEDRAVILACSTTTPMDEKIKCCEIFFETLNAPALCVQSQSVLALYGSGYTTGLCVDLGHDTTDITPVYEGGLISYAHVQTGLAGSQVSDYIKKCLDERGHDFGMEAPSIVEGIKKSCLYVTKNAAMSLKNCKRSYGIAEGEKLDVTQEAFMAAELLIQPDLVTPERTGFVPLAQAVVTSSLKCDSELRTDVYDAVVPCGGLAMIPGLCERLGKEIEEILQKPVNLLTSSEAYAVAWLGGATFAGLPDAQRMWVQKKQYEDHGAKIIRNRFL